ncbi:MAG: SDR family NAD(P)-dependent oxidoreductase [Anaerolineales bacterium]
MQKNIFQDRVTIISGASSGIGKALATQLAQKGAKVALAARNASALEQLANELQTINPNIYPIPTDITQPEQVQTLIESTLTKFGSIDYLFSNAGQYQRSRIVDLKLEVLRQSMEINFYGHVYLTLAVLPHMLQKQDGHIVYVSSMDAKKGLPLDAPYVSAKFALAGFADVLRQELFQKGIKVTTVFPGRVDTPMIDHLQVHWISAKISAEACAKGILRGVQKNKAEVILPPQTYLLYYLQVFSPRLADFAVRLFKLEGIENQ